MNENEFSKRVRKALKQAGCACYPVETGGTAVGFPDLVVMHKGGASFIELKCRPNTMLSRIVDLKVEGPGQRAFARNLSKRTSFRHGLTDTAEHSFLLVECMDGIALMVEDRDGAYPAACWEEFPHGIDLRDALRAWRVTVAPTEDMMDASVAECYRECALKYEHSTGIRLTISSVSNSDMSLADAGGREKAIAIARDICDRGRFTLLMESFKDEKKDGYLAPIEGGNGYVQLAKGE